MIKKTAIQIRSAASIKAWRTRKNLASRVDDGRETSGIRGWNLEHLQQEAPDQQHQDETNKDGDKGHLPASDLSQTQYDITPIEAAMRRLLG